jgi:serine protease Do
VQRRITPEVLVVRENSPAVVYIMSTGYAKVFDFRSGQVVLQENGSSGTGVIVDPDGFLVTNFHVVENAATPDGGKLQVQFDSDVDPKTYDAQLVSYVQQEDLALLKITGERKFPTVRVGTSADLMIGERVVAIGNPLQQKLSVSAGIISGLHREISVPGRRLKFNDLIQTDASINHGNSGGPLLNINGDLIGINTVVREDAENMGFAIPVDRVKIVLIDQLFAPQWENAWLGFELKPGPKLIVERVRAGSPAALGGVLPDDEILAFDGQVFKNREEYTKRRLTLLPGDEVLVRLRSDATEREVRLRGWSKVDGILFDRLGLTVQMVRVGYGTMLSVVKVAPDGPALAIGLLPGDVIDAVRNTETGHAWRLARPDELARVVFEMAANSSLEIDILRDENQDRRLEPGELFKGRLTLR